MVFRSCSGSGAGDWNGSVEEATLDALRAGELLHGSEVLETPVEMLDHWDPARGQEEIFLVRKSQLHCDVFISSVNALTEGGELVSRDGVGNRISAMTFGPAKVFLLASIHKIVPDLHAAFRRIREVAAPRRARSLGVNVPCTKGEGCVDCHSADRICRATLILHKRPALTDITVILIGEPLGY